MVPPTWKVRLRKSLTPQLLLAPAIPPPISPAMPPAPPVSRAAAPPAAIAPLRVDAAVFTSMALMEPSTLMSRLPA